MRTSASLPSSTPAARAIAFATSSSSAAEEERPLPIGTSLSMTPCRPESFTPLAWSAWATAFT